jgi:hypothetical protein
MTKRLFTRALHLVALALALAAVLVVPRAALAATTIAGGNIINQTWTPAGSPYIVQGDVTVPNGAFLNIQAGTVVQFASTDGQGAGINKSRIELTIKGTLNVTGQADNVVQFRAQSGSGASIWYGIVIDSTATAATIANATIANAANGIRTDAPGSVFSASNVAIDQSHTGVLIQAGTPTLTNISASNGAYYGIHVNGPASPTISGCTLKANASIGFFVYTDSGTSTVSVANCVITGSTYSGFYELVGGNASATTTITGSTLDNNGSHGVYLNASTASSSATVNFKNGNVTNHEKGFYTWGSGIMTANITYSNVWGNSLPYWKVSPGAGVISANPLYVSAPSNMRLTSNSPSRFAGDMGQDLGPLPYVNDATPGLHGVLWVNTTLGLAGSPYNVAGDLTVAPGVTLTIDPGVTLQFPANTDLMRSGVHSTLVELIVKGTLSAVGTKASPITMKSTKAEPMNWWGVVVDAAAKSATLNNVNLQYATDAIRSDAPGSVFSASNVAIDQSRTGVLIQAGTPTLTNISASNGTYYGIHVNGAASPTIVSPSLINNGSIGLYMYSASGTASATVTNALIRNSGYQGVYLHATDGASVSISMTNATMNANGQYGVQLYASSGSSSSATIQNSIITNNKKGFSKWGPGISTVNLTYSDVWGNGIDYDGFSPGVGCISQNPLYVAAPNDLRLAVGSVCIDAGTSMNAPQTDIEGKIRPIDGDGINGVAVDMGCYEYVPAFFKGDDTVNGSEAFDDGAENGQYAHGKLDGFGIGQKYGDGTVNGPEAGGEGGEGGDSGADLADTGGESGWGCRTARGNDGSPAGLVLVLAGALLAAKRRKRAA